MSCRVASRRPHRRPDRFNARAGLLGLLLACTGGIGCAEKLRISSFQKIELGKTTDAELLSIVGKPDAKQRITEGSDQFVLNEYHHVADMDYASAVVELRNDRVNGFEFFRTFTSHAHNQIPNIDQVVAKKSKKADVERLLDRPSTKAFGTTRIKSLRDSMPKSAAEVWGYYWQKTGMFSSQIQHFYVYFDASGTVQSTLRRDQK